MKEERKKTLRVSIGECVCGEGRKGEMHMSWNRKGREGGESKRGRRQIRH